MTGSEAIQALRDGKRVRRTTWDEHEALAYTPSELFKYPAEISPTYAYTIKRWKHMNDPRDLDRLFINTFTDFLMDDWEVVG
jgi:hypothetical protein